MNLEEILKIESPEDKGKVLEHYVYNELKNFGYNIISRNLRFNSKKDQDAMFEIDILTYNFMVEVKACPKLYYTNGFKKFLNNNNYFPKNFKCIYYLPLFDENEIIELNKNNLDNNIYYTKNLNYIYENFPITYKKIKFESNTMLSRFLMFPLTFISKFSEIYVTKSNFNQVLISRLYNDDYFDTIEKITLSDKIKYLLKNNIIKIMESCEELEAPYFTTSNAYREKSKRLANQFNNLFNYLYFEKNKYINHHTQIPGKYDKVKINHLMDTRVSLTKNCDNDCIICNEFDEKSKKYAYL